MGKGRRGESDKDNGADGDCNDRDNGGHVGGRLDCGEFRNGTGRNSFRAHIGSRSAGSS